MFKFFGLCSQPKNLKCFRVTKYSCFKMAIAMLESDQYRQIFIASSNQAEVQFSHYLQSYLI